MPDAAAPPTQPSWLARNFYGLVCAGFFALQLVFWHQTKDVRPELEIVPSVPGEQTISAIAFGDREFFFRALAINIQTFGDTYGRFSPLYKYDFGKLYRWFLLADHLDRQSDMIPTLASYYFSQTQHPQDNIWIVRYLQQFSQDRLREKWWWQAQAAYIANYKVKDHNLALKIALPLQNTPDIPFWARQMAAFIYEQEGEFSAALNIMENIKEHTQEIPQGELNFMRYFVQDRLKALDTASRRRALQEFPPQKPLTSKPDGKGGSSESYAPEKAVPQAVRELDSGAR
jgi:hypothetical protein